MKIETQRLILREYSDEDFTALHKIVSDPEIMSFWPEPFTEEKTKMWMKRGLQNVYEYGTGRLAVILKDNNRLIGDAGFIFTDVNGKPENDLGWIIDKKFWGRGFGTEAAGACIDFAFNSLGFNRIVANMAFDNFASKRVAEKIGMSKESEFYNKKNRNILTYLYVIEQVKREM